MGNLGILFQILVVFCLGYIGLKSFPIYSESLKIARTVKKISGDGLRSEIDIQAAFDRAAVIEDIHTIAGKDLVIDVSGPKARVSYSYAKKLPLGGPMSLLFEFEGNGN